MPGGRRTRDDRRPDGVTNLPPTMTTLTAADDGSPFRRRGVNNDGDDEDGDGGTNERRCDSLFVFDDDDDDDDDAEDDDDRASPLTRRAASADATTTTTTTATTPLHYALGQPSPQSPDDDDLFDAAAGTPSGPSSPRWTSLLTQADGGLLPLSRSDASEDSDGDGVEKGGETQPSPAAAVERRGSVEEFAASDGDDGGKNDDDDDDDEKDGASNGGTAAVGMMGGGALAALTRRLEERWQRRRRRRRRRHSNRSSSHRSGLDESPSAVEGGSTSATTTAATVEASKCRSAASSPAASSMRSSQSQLDSQSQSDSQSPSVRSTHPPLSQLSNEDDASLSPDDERQPQLEEKKGENGLTAEAAPAFAAAGGVAPETAPLATTPRGLRPAKLSVRFSDSPSSTVGAAAAEKSFGGDEGERGEETKDGRAVVTTFGGGAGGNSEDATPPSQRRTDDADDDGKEEASPAAPSLMPSPVSPRLAGPNINGKDEGGRRIGDDGKLPIAHDGGDDGAEEEGESSSDDDDDGLELCSILNLVVDHVMKPPSPMEPDEFRIVLEQRRQDPEKQHQRSALPVDDDDDVDGCENEANDLAAAMGAARSPQPPQSIRVPVLRIFGPVLRRRSPLGCDDNGRRRQPQSGCLHIHGAYPYLLARPVVAGPDASTFHVKPDGINHLVNWDDASSVELIVDEILRQLEGTLRSSFEAQRGGGNGGGGEACASNKAKDPPPRFIRRISVVTGRGFYTYCPGPPAPFLRVEYYDPALRWKVKMMLERGLEMPKLCHPDPNQYEAADDDVNERAHHRGGGDERDDKANDVAAVPLRFRCYEAHIPYTMQFFKDFNLSGASYVKVRDGRFRGPLPRSIRPRTRSAILNGRGDVDMCGGCEASKNLAFFLADNISPMAMWEPPSLPKATLGVQSTGSIGRMTDRDAGENKRGGGGSCTSGIIGDRLEHSSPTENPTEEGAAERSKKGSTVEIAELPSIPNQNAKDSLHRSLAGLSHSDAVSSFAISSTSERTPVKEQDEDNAPIQSSGTRQQSENDAGRVAEKPEGFSSLMSKQDQYWLKRETSCDVELDTTVQQILNVCDVMTSLPSDQAEREQIHWRAVPSLREIWEQERRRMSILLPPKDDFLSCPNALADNGRDDATMGNSVEGIESIVQKVQDAAPRFTLNVKKGASVPGAMLASKGMKQLIASSEGLGDAYQGALTDIVKRHGRFIDEAEEEMRCRNVYHKMENARTQATENGVSHKNGIDLPMYNLPLQSSPSADEVIEALCALEKQFSQTPDSESSLKHISGQLLSQDILTPILGNRSKATTGGICPLSQADVEKEQEIMEFGRRVDRCDSLDKHIGDIIDPHTLTPYEDHDVDADDDLFDEEDRMGEEGLERSLSILATQTIALPDDNAQTMSSPHKRRKEDNPVVRDIYASRLGPGEHKGSAEIHCFGLEVEKASDTEYEHDRECGDEDHLCSKNVQEEETALGSCDTMQRIDMAQTTPASDLSGTPSDSKVCDESLDKACPHEHNEATDRSFDSPPAGLDVAGNQKSALASNLQLFTPSSYQKSCLVEPRKKPPSRSECKPTDGGTGSSQSHHCWHPLLHRSYATSSPWLGFHLNSPASTSSVARAKAKREENSSSFSARDATMRKMDRSIGKYLEPVRRPPSYNQAMPWLKKSKKRKQSQPHETVPCAKRHKKDNGGEVSAAKKSQQAGISLEIDGNSRKLVVKSTSRKKKRTAFPQDVFNSSCKVFEVEEVDWDDGGGSQNYSPMPSQMSQAALAQTSVPNSQASTQENVQNEIMQPSEAGTETAKEGSGVDPARTQSFSGFLSASSSSHGSQKLGPTFPEQESPKNDPLLGIGQQGGRLHVEGGGGLKTVLAASAGRVGKGPPRNTGSISPDFSTAFSPLTIMSIEVHVQCRTGIASINNSKEIAMKPDSARDAIFAVAYVYGRDPGGGEALEVFEEGCIVVPVEAELVSTRESTHESTKIKSGMSSKIKVEVAGSERQLLLRLASIVQWKDPDTLISWDTQGAGVGYLIERGANLKKETNEGETIPAPLDLVRLFGRTPKVSESKGKSLLEASIDQQRDCAELPSNTSAARDESATWTGSGLGAEWDDRVGAGAAASSIVGRIVLCGWKIIAEEVKHPNASYQPAMVATVLNKRIPHHDDLILTRWYGANKGAQRWRVLHHRLSQATANLVLFDALDVIGRAGEAARLSGVEFSQSLPGIRGSQYKVEGVLLRALQSVWSDERGAKKGINRANMSSQQSDNSSKRDKSDPESQTQSPWKLCRNIHKHTPPPAHSDEHESGNSRDCGGNQHTDRGYFFFSPSKEDCSMQEALECQALTLEPRSGFHYDPVIVCDFTALYPSIVIAYNLCYSTCAGKLDYHSTRSEMGRHGQTTGHIGPFKYSERRTAAVLKHHMKSLTAMAGDERAPEDETETERLFDRAYAVPTGSLFVSETVLKGVLPQVLDELLSTRAMLKKAAKEYRRHVPNISPAVLRQLEARQLALKYVANVTYGYTSATFSGRSAMPLLADSIVECGRRTLSNAIDLANSWGKEKEGKWFGAEVIYGDTDSVFIKLPGRSVKEAFDFGAEYCRAVTSSNPPPIQLKLEKVYVASLLQTKKKYCGMKFESPTEKRPVFEAKGIETVRRDQCALTQKVLRNALVTLFRRGLDAVKQYLHRQWALIHAGRLPVSDFILTGRVRSRYRGGRIGPVQAALARRLAEADPGRVVRHKERLPYVIVAAPGLSFRLRDCVLTPMELLEQWDCFTIHAAYYTTKHVNAALQRCLGLAPYNIDVNSWYEACPKPRKRIHYWPITRGSTMISSYFGSDICALCGVRCKSTGSAKAVVCSQCRKDSVGAAYTAMKRLNQAQKHANGLAAICQACNGCYESSLTFATEARHEGRAKAAPNSIFGATIKRRKSGSGRSAGGIVTPLANCVCIDCPITYERHKMREAELEASALCGALDLF